MSNFTIKLNELDQKLTLLVEGRTAQETEKTLVFKIRHAQLVLTVDGTHKTDVTHKFSPDFIENQVCVYLQEKHQHKKVSVEPQKTGLYTNLLRVVVNDDGYSLEIINKDDHISLPAIFLGSVDDVKQNENVKQNLKGYQKGGARFIYQNGAHPDNDPF